MLETSNSMISSMTGYASHSADAGKAHLVIDLRSVNQRYLEISFRLPEELRAMEPTLREAIAERLARGKVECRITYTPLPQAYLDIGVNGLVLESLAQREKEVLAHFPSASPLSVFDILSWKGVLSADDSSDTQTCSAIMAVLEVALADLAASRHREGEKLKAHILQRLAGVETCVAEARAILPGVLSSWREKLASRLREALGDTASDRLAQEFALFAQKSDVEEELSRLNAHTGEVRRTLDKGGAAGKRLDFLMQEMHREANTLGSKSVASEMTRISVELKVLIEQMREQVQNIE
jgi:uncharacterized protein (TIGR00255 family)